MTVCIKSLKYICSRTFNNSPKLEPRNPNAHQQSRGRASSPRGVFYSSEDARAGRGLRDARRRPQNRASERGRVQVVRAACCRYAQPGQQRCGRARRGRGAVTRRGNVALRAPGARLGCAGRLSCAPRPCVLFHLRVAHQGRVSSACVQGKSSRLDGHSQDVGHQ